MAGTIALPYERTLENLAIGLRGMACLSAMLVVTWMTKVIAG
jgi:hypothetical protein